MKIPIDERIERLTNWFYRKNDRPLIGFFYGPQYPLHRFHGAKSLPEGELHPEDIKVSDFLEDAERFFKAYEEIGGDLIWSAAPFWGIPWVESSLGCQVIVDHSAGSSHTNPPSGFSQKPIIPEFSRDNPWVAKMLEFIPALEKQSAGRYPVGMTLMRGISDLLSALYGGEQFLFRMLESPGEVKEIVEQLTEYWISFGKCLLEHLPLFHGGTGAFFYGAWCPGKTIWLQEDAAALLSPNLYEEFIFPGVCKIADSFEYTIIHLHPSQFIPIDYLLKADINVIELHIDKGGSSAEELSEVHQKVLSQKPLLIWGDLSEADLEYILKNQSYEGLAIIIAIESIEEAHEIWDKSMRLISLKNTKV